MRSIRRGLPGILVLGLAASALAGGLSKKYKEWPKTPEADFLTSEEKAAWKNVKTDEAAQQFILDYKARRGPDFEKILADRVAAADKYFSFGETRGSETLRGKVIIAFGPPSGVEKVEGKTSEGGSPANTSVSGGGRNSGVAVSSFGPGPLGSSAHHAEAPVMAFVYDKASAPKAIGKAFRVEIRMVSNSDQEPVDPKDLEEKLEAVAKASIVPPPQAPPSN